MGRALDGERAGQGLDPGLDDAVIAPGAVEGRGRGNVDDGAVPRLLQMRHGVGGGVIGGLEIPRHDLVQPPARRILVQHARLARASTGIVHHHIDAPEALGHGLDHSAGGHFVAEIHRIEFGIGAQPLHLGEGIGPLGLVAADNGDPRTFLDEAPDDPPADPRIAAGDDDDLVLEPHLSLPFHLKPSACL